MVAYITKPNIKEPIQKKSFDNMGCLSRYSFSRESGCLSCLFDNGGSGTCIEQMFSGPQQKRFITIVLSSSQALGFYWRQCSFLPHFPLQSHSLSVTYRLYVVSRSLIFFRSVVASCSIQRIALFLLFSLVSPSLCAGWPILLGVGRAGLSGEGDAFMQNNCCDFDLLMPIQNTSYLAQ